LNSDGQPRSSETSAAVYGSPAAFSLPYVLMLTAVAALGGVLFGYDWVVIGGAKPFYERYFQLTSEQLVGWANSCALLGCLLGSLFSGALSDRYGRKVLLIGSAALFTVSSVATGWTYSFHSFIVWRIAGGIAIGVASNVSPMYIAEISPAHWRGRLVAVNQMGIAVGVLAAQIANYFIADKVPEHATAEFIRQSWNGQFGWRWMFSAVAVPALIFFAGSLILPESPRWMVANRRQQGARRTLMRIGGENYADFELRDIEETVADSEAATWKDLLHPRILKIVTIGVILAALQQWVGINVIFNYAEEIYREAGYGLTDTLLNIVATGVIALISNILAIPLVDRFGRRPLMLFGCAGIGVLHVAIAITYHMGIKGPLPLVLTLAAIATYGVSLAPVTWILIAEIFPTRIRGRAVAIAVSSLWIACFLVTFTFPFILAKISVSGAFWFYATICMAGLIFVYLQIPETKGRSLEQIERQFAGKHQLEKVKI
jgi:SP family xylose:H+ symportor-like MFS transporter